MSFLKRWFGDPDADAKREEQERTSDAIRKVVDHQLVDLRAALEQIAEREERVHDRRRAQPS